MVIPYERSHIVEIFFGYPLEIWRRLKEMTIEAIVSDVGGVILRDDFTSFFAQFEAKIGMSGEAFLVVMP